jgi:hypothetical protein
VTDRVAKWAFPTGDLQFLGSGIPVNRQKAITDVKNLPTYRGNLVFTAFRLESPVTETDEKNSGLYNR